MDAFSASIEELNKALNHYWASRERTASAYDEACQWSVPSFPVDVAPDLTEDEVITIYLIDTMEQIGHRGTSSSYPKADLPKYWLPKEYNLNTREFRGKFLPLFLKGQQGSGL